MAKKRRGGQQPNMPIPIDGDRRIVIQDVSTMVDQEKRITRMESLFFFILILLIVFVFFGEEIKAWLRSMTWWQTVMDNTPDWIKDNLPSPPTREKDPRTGRIPVVSAVLLGLAGLATTMILGYGAFVLFRRRRAKKVQKEIQLARGVNYNSLITNSLGRPNELDAIEKAMFFTRLFEEKDRRGFHSKNSGLWALATKETLIDVLKNLPRDSIVDAGTFLASIEERFRKEGGKIPPEKRGEFNESKLEMIKHLMGKRREMTEDEIESLEDLAVDATKMKESEVQDALKEWFRSNKIPGTEQFRYEVFLKRKIANLKKLPTAPGQDANEGG